MQSCTSRHIWLELQGPGALPDLPSPCTPRLSTEAQRLWGFSTPTCLKTDQACGGLTGTPGLDGTLSSRAGAHQCRFTPPWALEAGSQRDKGRRVPHPCVGRGTHSRQLSQEPLGLPGSFLSRICWLFFYTIPWVSFKVGEEEAVREGESPTRIKSVQRQDEK